MRKAIVMKKEKKDVQPDWRHYLKGTLRKQEEKRKQQIQKIIGNAER